MHTEKQSNTAYEEALALFISLRKDPENASTLEAFSHWLDESPHHEAIYVELMETWDDLAYVDEIKKPYVPTENTLVSASINFKKSRFSWFYSAAFAFCLSILSAGYFFVFDSPESDYSTAKGEYKTVHLADGSDIHMSAKTSLNVSFDDQVRRIDLLQGEAFFNVANDKTKPFIVYASAVETRALGTQFNIKYTDANAVTTSLIEGKVKVQVDSTPPLLLEAGQQTQWNESEGLKRLANNSTSKPFWMNRLIELDQIALEHVINELNQHSKTFIQVTNPELNKVLVSGTLPLNDLETALTLLKESLGINYTQFSHYLVFIY